MVRCWWSNLQCRSARIIIFFIFYAIYCTVVGGGGSCGGWFVCGNAMGANPVVEFWEFFGFWFVLCSGRRWRWRSTVVVIVMGDGEMLVVMGLSVQWWIWCGPCGGVFLLICLRWWWQRLFGGDSWPRLEVDQDRWWDVWCMWPTIWTNCDLKSRQFVIKN
jgi:hypothetical protein